jgi:hypothetical protein
MPLINVDEDTSTEATTSTGPIIQPKEKESTFTESVQAFTALENPLFNVTKEIFAPPVSDTFDPAFRPLNKLSEEYPHLMHHALKFNDDRNSEEFNRTLLNIEYEEEQREIFSRAPTMTKITAGLAASIADPLILVPYVGIAKTANTVRRAAVGLTTGLVGGTTAGAIRETILQHTQETRTAEESMVNILAEGALGGILGAGIGALANPARAAGKTVLAKALRGEDYQMEIVGNKVQVVPDSTVGAAATKTNTFEDLGLAHINERLARVVSGPDALKSPELRAILSPSEAVRKLGEVFYRPTFIREKNLRGIPTEDNAQTAIFQAEKVYMETLEAVDNLYLDYTGKGAIGSTLNRPKGVISPTEFSERVWKNLVDDARVDDIVQVNKAAQAMRKDLDNVARQLQETGLLPKDLDPKFMRNYMTRIYDIGKLIHPEVQGRFIRKVGAWMRKHHSDGSPRAKLLSKEEAEDAASKTLDKIRGESDNQIALAGISENFITKGKFLKKRQLLIPDSEIAEFLTTDASRLYRNYMSRASKLMETQKALERAGFNSITDVISQMRTEAAAAVKAAKTPKKALKIAEKFKEQEELATMMYRSLLGQLRKPGKADRYLEGLLNYQFVRLLGGVTISSLPELMMAPFRLGFKRTFRDGYLPMIRSLKTSNLTKDQLTDVVGALEIEQSNILRALGGIDDIDDMGRNVNAWDQTQAAITKGFARATGISWFTNMGRRVAAQVSSADIVRTLKAGVKNQKDIERFASIGIGKDDFGPILSQIERYAQDLNGSWVINPHLWTDQRALKKFKDAVNAQVELTILKPGVESTPFFVQQHLLGKVIFQFKSFMSSATNKVLISGLQRKDATVLTGVMGLIFAGAMSGAAHDMIAGRPVEEDFDKLLLDGISRSGMLGLVSTAVLDTGISFYDEKTRRFGGKFVAGNILGPSAGQIEESTRAIANIIEGDMTDKEKKAAIRMIPFSNIFYIKALIERAFGDK